MFRMSYDAVDFFSADFTAAGVIVAGEEYIIASFRAVASKIFFVCASVFTLI